jgi:hypothetical protein
MTSEQPEHLDLRSHDLVGDKVAELLALFPEVRTEDGQIDCSRRPRRASTGRPPRT